MRSGSQPTSTCPRVRRVWDSSTSTSSPINRPFKVTRCRSPAHSHSDGLSRATRGREHHEHYTAATNVQPESRASPVYAGEAPREHLLDMELSLGGQSRYERAGQPLFDDHGSAACRVAGV